MLTVICSCSGTSSQRSYREVVPIVVGLDCQLQKVLCVVVEGVALCQVA